MPIPQRVQATAPSRRGDGPSYSGVGYDTCVAAAGKKNWRTSDYIQAPVATSPTDVASFLKDASDMNGLSPLDGLNAHRDGYATSASRGPRFRHLPAPDAIGLSPQCGSGQPALASRIPTNEDVRLVPIDNDGAFKLTASPKGDLDPALATNLVPYPYVKAYRPEQRLRAVSVGTDFKGIVKSLERSGLWHTVGAESEEEGYKMLSESELRDQCARRCLPTFGTRMQLLERIQMDSFIGVKYKVDWARKELNKLGVEVTKDALAKTKDVKLHFFSLLPDEYLEKECSFRNIPFKGRPLEEVLGKLQKYGGN